MNVSDSMRRVADFLWDRFGDGAVVHQYGEGPDLLVFDSRVEGGEIAFLSSIGFSDYDFGAGVDGKPLRVELLYVPLAEYGEAATDFLAACALSASKNQILIQPDVLLPGMVELIWPDAAMKHVLLMEPFSAELPAQDVGEKIVAWLELAPISESERVFAEQNGAEALKAKFAEAGVEFCDLNRASIV